MVRSGLARSVSTPTRIEASKTGLNMTVEKEEARRVCAGLPTHFVIAEFRHATISLLQAQRARDVDATSAELRIVADIIRRAEDAGANLSRAHRIGTRL